MITNDFNYLQYGCGYLSNPEGWKNFDASPTLFFQKVPVFGFLAKKILKPEFPNNVIFGDILRGLPVEKESFKGIYCSHVLEHLSLEDFKLAIKKTYEYLAPNGVFRLVMPDLHYLAQQYIDSDNPSASVYFMKATLLGTEKRERAILGFLRGYIGNSHHLWLWDFNSVRTELSKVGFREIRRAYYGDSRDPKFKDVEERSRWEDNLGVECIR